LIDDPEELNAMPLNLKAVSLHWEMMFTRSLFGTPDMAEQGKLLSEVAALVDAGRNRSTATEVAGKIDAATLRAARSCLKGSDTVNVGPAVPADSGWDRPPPTESGTTGPTGPP
jgi:hypothetical protein